MRKLNRRVRRGRVKRANRLVDKSISDINTVLIVIGIMLSIMIIIRM